MSETESASSTPAALLTLGLALDPVLRKAPLVPATDPNATTTIYLDNFFASGNIQAIVERAFIDNLEPGDQVTYTSKMLRTLRTSKRSVLSLSLTRMYRSHLTTPGSLPISLERMKKPWSSKYGLKLFVEPVRLSLQNCSFGRIFTRLEGYIRQLPGDVNPAFALPVVTGDSNTPDNLQPGDRANQVK